jgi:hypothetical protein
MTNVFCYIGLQTIWPLCRIVFEKNTTIIGSYLYTPKKPRYMERFILQTTCNRLLTEDYNACNKDAHIFER